MDIALPPHEPSAAEARRDRHRVFWAALGAAGLLGGIWLVWLGAFAFDWDMDALGIRPRDAHGLLGILTAPFVHASFEHLVANTLPLGILAALTLYAYPRAARRALPLIWLLSGLGVWLWARPSLHVGISGITHGLMFFLFLTGLLRRDRLGVTIALLVFFLYGGMTLTVLPREENVSFEYHMAGALAGVAAALLFHHLDPLPPRKRYSWEEEEDAQTPAEAQAQTDDEPKSPPPPSNVPATQRTPDVGGDNIIVFRPRERR